MTPFENRRQAGRALARKLSAYAGRDNVIVLALPRGGVPVGYEIAEALDAPLDVFLVRKLGAPGQEELAMGALASDGVRVLNPNVIVRFGVSEDEIEAVVRKERRELARREREYRGDRPPLELRGRTVILVDDGVATGSSMRAAIAVLRTLSPRRLVVAVPVAPPSTARELSLLVDDFVCLATPEPFDAVGTFYETFEQIEDEEVRDLLARRCPETSAKDWPSWTES
jgi:putative phosphoribosyl transferase